LQETHKNCNFKQRAVAAKNIILRIIFEQGWVFKIYIILISQCIGKQDDRTFVLFNSQLRIDNIQTSISMIVSCEIKTDSVRHDV